jgi:hypothetical protein
MKNISRTLKRSTAKECNQVFPNFHLGEQIGRTIHTNMDDRCLGDNYIFRHKALGHRCRISDVDVCTISMENFRSPKLLPNPNSTKIVITAFILFLFLIHLNKTKGNLVVRTGDPAYLIADYFFYSCWIIYNLSTQSI